MVYNGNNILDKERDLRMYTSGGSLWPKRIV